MRGAGALLLLAILESVNGETYNFADAAVPGARSLNVIYKFHVQGSEWSSEPVANMFFKDVKLITNPDDAAAPVASALAGYQSVEIMLVKENDYGKAVGSLAFCSYQGRFVAETGGPFMNMTATEAVSTATLPVTSPGIYLLIITNCGDLAGLALRGNLALKHDWGLLTPLEKGAEGLYGLGVCFYVACLVCWTWACSKYYTQLFLLQKGIFVTLVICCVEAVAWWAFFQDRNTNGGFPRHLFTVAGLASAYKMVAMFYSIISNPSKGVHADQGISFAIHLLPMLFLIFKFHHSVVEFLRHGYAIPFWEVLLSAAPAVVMGLVLALLAIHRLSRYIESLEEEKDQAEQVKMYRRLKGLVFLMSLVSAGILAAEVFDVATIMHQTWMFQSAVTHGIPQMCFAGSLLVAMFFSWPSGDLQGYAYDNTENAGNVAIGMPMEEEDETMELGNRTPSEKLGAVE
mmetsp:Transcript_7477/g.16841  ORF Transcript_7477/g.16841 Transcript_7477/m.16841 type:complete len:459 (-) Transcript_7477:30-1406(-)|eukprot:CAMPEP_0206452730 /NCGR_PEP_ID=MMETSP0324_2-20121206/20124_1 /ASSEMBLY_ACC=CAM_ASM_000836 /TAXON_ID=2866 /ORGANISM="Crypthecodinium cohnii, Strain Seligo" /LENGTH=458 /DNA_ID=CAMNT_0053922885 /DNA_START=64 /DNA_END=1440 /DNA_ORIENTATION=-